jgi:hypothetical protein
MPDVAGVKAGSCYWLQESITPKGSKGVPWLPSSEMLFNTLLYALFVTPAAVVVIWVVWRVMVWCLYHTALVSAWVGRLPAILQVPIVIGLLLLAWPLLLLALFSWLLIRVFPGLAVEHGEVPRLFARNRSQALSYIFLSFLIFLPVVVPLSYLADRLEGPQISFWHWLLVFGPIPVLIIWLVARIRRIQRENVGRRGTGADAGS